MDLSAGTQHSMAIHSLARRAGISVPIRAWGGARNDHRYHVRMKIKITDAQVVLPTEICKTSVLVEDDRIAVIDAAVHTEADEVVSANGLHLIPGVIDDQVHFREPGLEHKEDLRTASRACAKGGVTSYFEMPNTNPSTITVQRLDEKLQLAASKSVVNYAFYVGATPDNVEELQQAKRTPGIKIFIGSSTGQLLVDEQAALERIFAETTLPITAHCEDETTVRANKERFADSTDVADHSKIRNREAAIIATRRAIDLATRYKHQFHVLHVTTADEIPLIADSPDWVTAEACSPHLFFTQDDYERLGTKIQGNPSVKTSADQAALWQALHDGVIRVVATDHAPHTMEEKNQSYPKSPSGMPSIENSLALMLNAANENKCSLEQVVRWMCEAPADIWHVANKGRIEVGYDADLVLIDLAKETAVRDEDQLTKCGWSPWHGTTLKGWPVRTWVMGNEVFRDNGADSKPSVTDKNFGHEVRFARS